jgi:transcription initiation factor TFIID subunit 2
VPDAPKTASKPRGRKPKVIDVPPPPYIDDGSHDLLQEVIAIEKETKEKRRRSTSEKDLLPEKRKRLSPKDEDDVDDILALAAPISSKRKNSGLSSASTTDALENGAMPEASPAALDSPAELPPAQPSVIRISLKGKEKEVVPSPPRSVSKPSKSPSTHATPLNEKKCRDVLKALLKPPEAIIFSKPVDPVNDGCPT